MLLLLCGCVDIDIIIYTKDSYDKILKSHHVML